MAGWRGRFGYVSPSTIELPWELEGLLPEGVGVIAASLGVRAHQAAEFERALAAVEAAVALVVGEGAHAVVLAGTPLAVRQGYHGEREANRRLSERAGVPVTSAMAAAVDGLRHLDARRPVVATAYLPEFNEQIARYLAEAELPVVGMTGLSVRSPAEAARVEMTTYYRLARELVEAHPEADAVLLGTRGNVQDVARTIEEDLGLPVLHSTGAGLWWALRRLRVAPRPGGGRLLASG